MIIPASQQVSLYSEFIYVKHALADLPEGQWGDNFIIIPHSMFLQFSSTVVIQDRLDLLY